MNTIIEGTLKIGNRVKALKDTNSGAKKGGIYTVTALDASNATNFEAEGLNNRNYWSDINEFERMSGKGRVTKEVPFSFVLQYERNSDPLELFRTMVEVKARITDLCENDSSVKRDSFVVYEIKGLPKKVTVSTAIKVGNK